MDTPPEENTEVRDNPDRRRFELSLGEQGSAFIDYRDRPVGPATVGQGGTPVRVRVLTHAEVPAALRGAGIGSRLTRGTLDLIRARGERIVPLCPYVVDFIRRHPDYRDLLAD